VYCEVGILTEALDKRKQAAFANRLAELIARSAGSDRFPFSEKIMYGSDWFMPDAAGAGVQFLEAYQRVFLLPKLSEYYDSFFRRNAVRFLNLEERLRLDRTLPPALKTKLERVIKDGKVRTGD
jgi:RES domain-containing protein